MTRPIVGRNRAVVRRPDVDTIFSVNPDGSRNPIHPADVRGRFQRRKHALWYGFLVLYLAVPWLEIGGHPVLLIDFATRHFWLLGSSFDAQDFWLAFFFVTGLGFALFVLAAVFGRVWCGFACPQTVFLEGVFRRIERWIEGPAAARARLDKAPWTTGKVVRRGTKLVVFLAIAAVIAHAFLGYFMPVQELVAAVTATPGAHPTAFLFMVVATLALFVNFTWFREQTCIVVCPYGRLQGALYDPDTVIVGYDTKRGEPRGAAGTAGAGDCVDCYRCVSVCPTGIDIRNGAQLECVGCANCIDACDDVMAKLARPSGLIRYDSQRGFDLGERRFWRGRVALYAVLLVAGVAAFAFSVTRRHPFEASLERAPGRGYFVEGERVHNVFTLHVVNKLPEKRVFHVDVVGPREAEVVVAMRELTIGSFAEARVPVHVFVPNTQWHVGLRCELKVRCDDPGGELVQLAAAPLLGPSARR